MVDADRLRSLPLFNILGEEERAAIAELVDDVDVPAGEPLVAQGEVAYDLFVIEAGQADVLVDGGRVAELRAGDFFGEVALLETGQRIATVVAASPMKLIKVDGENFQRIQTEYPQVAERLQDAVRRRVVIARA